MELVANKNLEVLNIEYLANIDGGWTPGGMFWAMGTGAGGGAVNYAVSDYLK